MKPNRFFWDNENVVSTLLYRLECDRLSIVSTDTILGFLGRCSAESYEALNVIKGCRSNKPYLILIGNLKALDAFVDISVFTHHFLEFLRHLWPNPVTIIFKARSELDQYMTNETGTIAIRMPKHDGLLKLLQYEKGVFSTSANKSGQKPPETYEQIDSSVLEQIDLVVLDNKEPATQTKPSTIIDCSAVRETGQVRIIREGAFPIKDLEGLYGETFIK